MGSGQTTTCTSTTGSRGWAARPRRARESRGGLREPVKELELKRQVSRREIDGRLNPLQHDDRDRPRGLRHVFAKPGHVGGVLLVEAVTLRSARDRGRTDMELLGADLDVGLAGL